MKGLAGITAIAVVIAAYYYTHRPICYPAGVLINNEPGQILLPEDLPPIAYGAYSLKPLAMFSVDARVLHRRNYRYDAGASLVPVDLALGWGSMSDQHVLDQLRISQSMRFYFYEYTLPPPLPPSEIVSHSANMHIIPANQSVASKCESLRAGALVHLIGNLVEATGPKIGRWRSSLTRTDTGNGACELFYVEEVREISPETTQPRLATRR